MKTEGFENLLSHLICQRVQPETNVFISLLSTAGSYLPCLKVQADVFSIAIYLATVCNSHKTFKHIGALTNTCIIVYAEYEFNELSFMNHHVKLCKRAILTVAKRGFGNHGGSRELNSDLFILSLDKHIPYCLLSQT